VKGSSPPPWYHTNFDEVWILASRRGPLWHLQDVMKISIFFSKKDHRTATSSRRYLLLLRLWRLSWERLRSFFF